MADLVIATAVGTGEKGFAGDGGPATAALLNGPFDVVFDGAGNLYFSDTFNHRIRRVDAQSGVITTIAGDGQAGYGGDDGPAVRASLNEPYGIAVDRAGNIFIADRLNRRVRRVDAASGIITTLAGTGEAAYSGDGGPAARAGLAEPNGLAFDAAQRHLYITDVADHRVRIVDLVAGTIATFAGTGKAEHSGDGGPASAAGIFGARAVKLRCRRDGLHPGASGQQPACGRSGDRYHHDDRRHRRARLWRRWRPGAGRGVRRAEGDGDRPRRQRADRRYENHAIRRFDRRTGLVTAIARRAQGWRVAMGDRRWRPASTGRTARCRPTALSISATPTTTASAR